MIESLDTLKAKVSKEGYVFRSFVLETASNCSPLDVDWNYKDVPHAEFVHDTVENTPVFTQHDLCCSIAYQRVAGFIKLPVALVNFDYDETSHLYYSTLLFWVLLIQTKIIETKPGKVLVKTEYHIGSPKGFSLSFWLIKFLITRNYKNLMRGETGDEGDVGMRVRRWWLREKGYAFASDPKSGWKHSFLRSMNLAEKNVIPPKGLVSRCYQYEIDFQKLKKRNELLFGEEDHSGLIVRRHGSVAYFFIRICLHQGACLDRAKFVGDAGLQCPWHGLVNRPLYKADIEKISSATVKLLWVEQQPKLEVKIR